MNRDGGVIDNGRLRFGEMERDQEKARGSRNERREGGRGVSRPFLSLRPTVRLQVLSIQDSFNSNPEWASQIPLVGEPSHKVGHGGALNTSSGTADRPSDILRPQ